MSLSGYLLLILLVLLAVPSNTSPALYYSKTPINNVVVVDNKVYIGAVNEISLLTLSDFSVLFSSTTGPVDDSPLCNHDGSSCLRGAVRTRTDNYNKVLLKTSAGLLACGSVRQGVCVLHSASDLTVLNTTEVAVAANRGNSSTVSLLLPDGRLVVAASHSVDSAYRDPFPALSIRQPSDYAVVNSGSLEGEAAVYLRAEFRHSYPIRYLASFQHQHFVYIAAVQPAELRQTRNGPLVTKLIRVCEKDTRFVSYSEIELQCRSEHNSNYPELTAIRLEGNDLIASFTNQGKKSAICIFSMQTIKLTFWYNIDRCRSGTDSIGLPHVGRDSRCINKSRVPLDEDTCELGVGGSIEAVEMASIEIPSIITSLNSVSSPRVVLAGTDYGDIIQLKSKQSSELEEYGRMRAGDAKMGVRIESIQILDGDVLVQLPSGLVLLPLSSCEQYSTCGQCLLSVDPLCQWCHPKGICTTSAQCNAPTSSICPLEKGGPVPDSMPLDELVAVKIPIQHLPQPDAFAYECAFGSSISLATWSDSGVECIPPKNVFLEASVVRLAVRTSLSLHPIVAHNFSFYNCGQYTTCSSCSSSSWQCEWCAAGKQCKRSGACLEDKASECVHIDSASQPEIRIPNGRSRIMTFPLKYIERLPKDGKYTCRALLSGKTVESIATLGKDSVSCGQMTLSYREQLANMTVPLEFVQDKELVDSTTVILYECSMLAADCSSCLSMSPSWGCSWCSGRCSPDCPPAEADAICDRPTILEFSPTSGPLQGGTLINITGRDLGSSLEEVKDRIWVAGSRCHLQHYEISKNIVCKVEKGTSSGPIRITIGKSARRTAESDTFYSFVDTSLYSIYPQYGPVSGGTRLTLYGQNLLAGSDAKVLIGNRPCNVLRRNSSTSLSCITSPYPSPKRLTSITLSIDDATVPLTTPFEYRQDPVITSVYPLVSFRSGGKMIYVQGSNFDTVLNVKMFLLSTPTTPYELVSELAPCQVHNSTNLLCSSPKVFHIPKNNAAFSRYPVGFMMDNVTSVRNLGHRIQMTIVPDPQFAPFKGIRIHQGDQPLILDGNYLGQAAEPQDYKIYIGADRCYVTLVDSRQLVCNGPQSQPPATDENGSAIQGSLPLVTATVGKVRTELGLIEYANPIATLKLWVLVISTVGALCVVLVLLIVVWKKRRNERERDYKKIQMQMEHLESNVRKECKQAFAELQTSITTCGTEDIDGADFVSFREFVSRLLWSEGALSVSTSLYGSTLSVTLAQFDALLGTKHFVFALVETAESDSSISPSEKSLLSSLLISVLLRNFHYCTEVVMSLLRAHIAKTVQQRTSELLFRKSESIVEKMVAKWLTICLHDHLQQGHAIKYYNLYKALKYQTEKGPVDVVTGNARYTINEAKLLRETVDTTTLECYVMNLDGRGPSSVRLNACDSISQAKQKVLDVVFKHVPHSQRPAITHFHLEWQCSKKGPILLLDDDKPPSIQKCPRRLNTLAHYNLVTGAVLTMVPNSTKNTYRNSLGDSGQSSCSSLDRSSPYYSPALYYHLSSPSRTLTMDKKRNIDESIPKSIPEVYLTRLLTSKGTVQKYIEEFLESVLFLEETAYPPVLKFIFDVFDEEAARNGIRDENLIQQWKSNLYVLRVWVNLIKNPKILFDIPDSISVDSNMSVIAQTMMDCFSFSEPILGANSPSSRLLFAKDVSRLRPMSADFFRRIRRQPKLHDSILSDEFSAVANDLSGYGGCTMALSELLSWVRGNGIRVVEVLSGDSVSVENRLPQKLSQVLNLSLEQENIYSTIPEYIVT